MTTNHDLPIIQYTKNKNKNILIVSQNRSNRTTNVEYFEGCIEYIIDKKKCKQTQ